MQFKRAFIFTCEKHLNLFYNLSQYMKLFSVALGYLYFKAPDFIFIPFIC